MAADIQDWLNSREFLARRVTSGEVLGLLKRTFQVPANTVAHVVADGTRRVARGGEQLAGRFDAILIKTQEIPVTFSVQGLRSKDSFGMNASVRLTLQLESFEPDRVEDFCKNFAGQAQTSTEDLRSYLAVDVKRALSEYVGSHDAAELQSSAASSDLEGGLRRALEGPLFGKGLTFRKLMELEFQSESFDRARNDLAKEKEKLREHEAGLLDQQRREEKVKRLAALMKSEDTQQVFREIKDEKVRSLLYAKMMEGELTDLSSDEIRGKLQQWGDDLVGVVLKAYASLSESPEPVTAEPPKPERLERILVTAGSRILLFKPEDFVKSCRLVDAGFNLRSARMHIADGRSLIFAGGKRQVSSIDPETGQQVSAYPLPEGKKPKGGVNATALWRNRLFATHSEIGVIEWDLSKPGAPGTMVFADLTALSSTVRAATVSPEGMLYFASGRTVFAANLATGAAPTSMQPQAPSGVTAISIGEKLLIAGCGSGNDGALVVWDRADGARALSVMRRNAPIGSTRLASIGGVPHILFTCRDHGVTARVLGQTLETQYEAGEHAIILAEGGSDYIVAIDQNGRYLLSWDCARPAKPRAILDLNSYVDQPVYDLTPVFGAPK